MKTLIFAVILSLAVNAFATKPLAKEVDITQCKSDSDCVIVPYSHCCGSTKKAINKKFLDLYKKTKAWQKFDDPQTCAVVGACMSDAKVKEAKCEAGQCQLRFPN